MKGNYLLVILIFGSLQLAAQSDTIVSKNILYAGEADKKLALDIYKLKEQKKSAIGFVGLWLRIGQYQFFVEYREDISGTGA